MIKDTYYYNGIKAVNINNLPDEAWEIISGNSSDNEETIVQLYHHSAFFRRCVDIRAQAVSRLPRDIMKNGEAINEKDEPLLNDLSRLLFQIEVALILYGFAYLLKEQNMMAMLDVRWLSPKSIMPKYDKKNGLAGFARKQKDGEPKSLDVDDVMYFWTPPLDAEVGPGKPVGDAAARAANVLEGTTLFSKGFFERGAIFPMLLSVEGEYPKSERDKLKSWWERLTRGVKDAWNTITIHASVKPQIIGPPISEMAMKDLNEIQRENVATALGIPHSLVLSNASNFATSQQDYINFYDLTITPEAQLIADVFNVQLLDDLGMELVFQPSRLDVFQQANLQASNNVTSLVGGKIITVDEARDVLGYEPMEAEMGEDAEPIVMQLPVPDEPPEDDEMRRVDLDKWRRKSLSSLKANDVGLAHFESNHISYAETQQIVNELALCFTPSEVKAVFDERLDHSH